MTTILHQATLTAKELLNVPWVYIEERLVVPYVNYDYSKKVKSKEIQTEFPQGLTSMVKRILDDNCAISFASDLYSHRIVTIVNLENQTPRIVVSGETVEEAINQAFQLYATFNGVPLQYLTTSNFGKKLQTCNLDNLINWHSAKVILRREESHYRLDVNYLDSDEKGRIVVFEDIVS